MRRRAPMNLTLHLEAFYGDMVSTLNREDDSRCDRAIYCGRPRRFTVCGCICPKHETCAEKYGCRPQTTRADAQRERRERTVRARLAWLQRKTCNAESRDNGTIPDQRRLSESCSR